MTGLGARPPGPEATVIVPTFDDWQALDECLAALAAQSMDPARFEILVADNNPADAPPAALSLPPNARRVWQPKPGSYAARNAALAEARGAVLLFTDADCRPAPQWLAVGLGYLQAHPDVMRCAGRVEVAPVGGRWTALAVYDDVFRLDQAGYVKRGRAATANLAVRRAVFDRVGPFDETRFSGGDMEWNKRATAQGMPLVYLPDMLVLHPARESFAENARKVARLAGARYVTKQGSPLARRVPRIHYLVPSPRALARLLLARHHPLRLRLAAWGWHYILRLVDVGEILRLGLLGKAPERR